MNIDDAVENAYRNRFADAARQKLRSVSWRDRFRMPIIDEVVLVHLHGVAWANHVDDLVFDISSYLYAVQAKQRWHSIFADSYADTPTIVLGASLSDEMDLETVLERGQLSGVDAPSIVVSPGINEFDAERFRNFGLVPVDMTAMDFVAKVKKSWDEYSHKMAPTEDAGELLSPVALRFLHQWRPLNFKEARTVDPKHDFYGGHEPQMTDIANRLDADREIIGQVKADLTQSVEQGIVGLTGSRFAGKTTAALRVAHDLVGQGWNAYEFDPEFRPDVDAVLWWSRRFPRTLLVMDDAADFGADLSTLGSKSLASNVPVHMLLVERTSRAKELYRGWDRRVLVERVMKDRLTVTETNAVIDKLTGAKRMGTLTGKKRSAAIDYFMVEHRGILFGAMSELERADGFRGRMTAGYHNLNDQEKMIFQLVALASALGYGLPVGAVAAISLTPAQVKTMIASDSMLSDFVYAQRGRLYLRHRSFGPSAMEMIFDRRRNFDYTLDLAKHLAPHISPAAISARSFSYRLIRQLLDHDLLTRWIGTSRLDEWYQQLEDAYSWNSRFWEQRALAATKLGRYAPATSWARHAVKVHYDALTLNTLATVLLRRDLDENGPENQVVDNYNEAVALLQEARAVAAQDSEYPYITFFRYTLTWVERWHRANGVVDAAVQRRWNDWKYWAENAQAFAYPEGQRALQGFQASWLKLGL